MLTINLMAEQKSFHSMACKRVKGSKTAIKLTNNRDKVSSFCNDVIGDICGIISGSAGVTITANLSKTYNLDIFRVGLVITGIVASLTIGGKAICKSIAIKNSEKITFQVGKVVSVFKK